jgi:aspartate/methionine/tyrosine aminotransferase
MQFPRMPIEAESPEQFGYDRIRFNLTESSLRDRSLAELGVRLDDQLLCYTDHLGHPPLRELIAQRAGAGFKPDDVLLTAGAAQALFIIAVTLLDAGEHMVVVRPNYATNIETPRVLKCQIDYVDLDFDHGFQLDLDRLAAAIRPNTRLISLTQPHNPTGAAMSAETLRAAIALADRVGADVLVDETYRDMSFIEKTPVAAGLGERVISVSSLSKSYGVPGIRLGWILARDPALMHRFLCAKEQIGICGSVIDEAIGHQVYAGAEAWLAESGARLREGFDTVSAWVQREPLIEWVAPTGGCVCFPRVRDNTGFDAARFYGALNNDHGAYVGPGHWFEMPDCYFRIGYGWPTPEELAGGLAAISAALRG